MNAHSVLNNLVLSEPPQHYGNAPNSAGWNGRKVENVERDKEAIIRSINGLFPYNCYDTFKALDYLRPCEFQEVLDGVEFSMIQDLGIENYAIGRSHFNGEQGMLFYLEEVLHFLKEHQKLRSELLTKVVVKDLLDKLPSDQATNILEQLQFKLDFLTQEMIDKLYLGYAISRYPVQREDSIAALHHVKTLKLKPLVESFAQLPRDKAYSEIKYLHESFPEFSENALKKAFEKSRLKIRDSSIDTPPNYIQRPPLPKEFWKKELLGHMHASKIGPPQRAVWTDWTAASDYINIRDQVPPDDVKEVTAFINNQYSSENSPFLWEGLRYHRASFMAYMNGVITLDQHQKGLKKLMKHDKDCREKVTDKAWELFPKPYMTLKEIEESVSPEDIQEVTKLINSDAGLASTDTSPIFWEDLRFPHACLCAYLQEQITLNQLVSATMLFGIIKDCEIENASLITRKPLREIQMSCPQEEPVSEHYYYRVTIEKSHTVARGLERITDAELLPSPFILEDDTLNIPSFSSLQMYLDDEFGEQAILMVPRWGNSTMNEVYEQMLHNQHPFGIDPTGETEPDDLTSKRYGFSLHDFYHSYRSSSIPLNHRQAYLQLAKALLDTENKALQKTAWKLIDMEFLYKPTDHPDGQATHFYYHISKLNDTAKFAIRKHLKENNPICGIDVDPLILLLSDEDF